jgi:hypothetical protein
MVKHLFIVEFIGFILYCINALYYSRLMTGLIQRFFPLLQGFNWGRVWIFNRVLWYVVFALCLQIILRFDFITVDIDIGHSTEKVKFSRFLIRLFAGILVCSQIVYIAMDQESYYNNPVLTWRNFAKIVVNKIIPNSFSTFTLSYKEFFAKDLFDRIKSDISYSDERMAALGYHPSVLMYNGFNCIDGYNSAYPLSYMLKFRTLIAPELEVNGRRRNDYDSTGRRMYLYGSGLSYEPTRNKDTSPVELNIDMEVFRNDFDGVYILSRAEISNNDELGLDLVRRYYDDESIYTIYLYQCRL